jgi:diguanylate cyclase (GGDEF)-like protein
VAYVLAVLAVLLVGAGYVLGLRRARSREDALKTLLDERSEKLTLVEDELLRNSSIDPSTGLHTQQLFQEFLEREWRRASRQRQWVSIIMVEVDHFREFYERQGTHEGDACFKIIADVLKPFIHRPSDVLARYGEPGKFGIVLGATDRNGTLILAERLRSAVEALKKPNQASPTGQLFTASLGAASAMPDREDAWQDIELIAAAERALAHAKEAGRNTVFFDAADAVRSS